MRIWSASASSALVTTSSDMVSTFLDAVMGRLVHRRDFSRLDEQQPSKRFRRGHSSLEKTPAFDGPSNAVRRPNEFDYEIGRHIKAD